MQRIWIERTVMSDDTIIFSHPLLYLESESREFKMIKSSESEGERERERERKKKREGYESDCARMKH